MQFPEVRSSPNDGCSKGDKLWQSGWTWFYTLVIPTFERQRQVDLFELEASLIYLVLGQLGLCKETVLKSKTKQQNGSIVLQGNHM